MTSSASTITESTEPQSGSLYVVSTPIGNLEDITFRAIRILRGVNLVVAEDTRVTRILLRHYSINIECLSCNAHNERSRIPVVLERLQRGDSIAVVSDAGTPGISDPAAVLISSVIEAGYPVIPIPGACAALAALVTSGMTMDRFHFEGFLPVKKRRKTRIQELALEHRTIILYESVHRISKTLTELQSAFGDRRVSVSRELTKKFEETIRGTIGEVMTNLLNRPPRGEFVIVIEGRQDETQTHFPEV